MSELGIDIDIMLGLDDIAHNRLYTTINDEWVPVPNYGRRNPDAKCYCKELKRLGVRR
jgi:hypothetical protein